MPSAFQHRRQMRCPICLRALPAFGTVPNRNDEHIDHDHVTGRIRGVLCGGCNTALGKFGDGVEGLLRALEYLRAAD